MTLRLSYMSLGNQDTSSSQSYATGDLARSQGESGYKRFAVLRDPWELGGARAIGTGGLSFSTQRCPRRDNWHTRGSFVLVLSY